MSLGLNTKILTYVSFFQTFAISLIYWKYLFIFQREDKVLAVVTLDESPPCVSMKGEKEKKILNLFFFSNQIIEKPA